MKQYRNNFRGPRAGVTVTELVVAAALLSAALLLAIQTVHLAGRQQQVGRSQRLALQEASGAMERLMALPYDELTSEAAERMELAPEVRLLLPNATLQLEITPVDKERAKQVTVTVMWGERTGPVRPPQSLVAYRFAPVAPAEEQE